MAVICLSFFSCNQGNQHEMDEVCVNFLSDSEDLSKLDILEENVLIPLGENANKDFLLKQMDKVVVKGGTIQKIFHQMELASLI